MPNDLRSLWPALTKDHRNALVAMGMGWTLWVFELSRPGRLKFMGCPPDEERYPGDFREQGRQTSWGRLPADPEWVRPLPDYCGSWEGFGRIWEACREREYTFSACEWASFHDRRSGVKILHRKGAPLAEVVGTSDPRDALAVAFVLASGVEIPEEWLPGVMG